MCNSGVPRVCNRGVYPGGMRGVPGYKPGGMRGVPGYTRVVGCTLGYTQGGRVYPRLYPGGMRGIYQAIPGWYEVYTRLYTTRVCTTLCTPCIYTYLHTLGIPSHPACTWCSTGSSGLGYTLRGDEALGSTLRIVRRYEAHRALQPPKV